jgi:hypothetical protein
MLGKKTVAALGIAAVTLVLGVGVAAAADEDGKEQQGTRVTSEQPDATKPPTLAAPATQDGKDQ